MDDSLKMNSHLQNLTQLNTVVVGVEGACVLTVVLK